MRTHWLGVLVAASVAAVPLAASATASKLYDMNRFLTEPHPFAGSGPAAVTSTRPQTQAQTRPAGATQAPVRRTAQAPASAPRPAVAPPPASRVGAAYLSASGGLSLLTDATNEGSVFDIESEFDFGYGILAAGGYKWRNGLRAEAELGYRSYGIDKLTITRFGNLTGVSTGGFDADGSVSSLSLMLNAAYDLDTDSAFSPFVLAGAGFARVSADDVEVNGAKIVDDSAWVPAFQLGFGLNYALDGHWSLEAGYRFYLTLDPELEDAAGDTFDSEFLSHDVLVGARYAF